MLERKFSAVQHYTLLPSRSVSLHLVFTLTTFTVSSSLFVKQEAQIICLGYYSYIHIRCRGNTFTKSLPSNSRLFCALYYGFQVSCHIALSLRLLIPRVQPSEQLRRLLVKSKHSPRSHVNSRRFGYTGP
jgi:hypothetical protein